MSVATAFENHKDFPLAQKIFWFGLLFHVVAWTLVPTLLRYQLPMDSLEAATWGQHLTLGYDKNPYFNAWLVAAIVKLSNYSDWAIYLGSKLVVALCFYSIWRLSRYFLTPLQAIVAIFMLEGLQYFNIAAVELNDNVLEIGLWALLISFFYTAVKHDSLKDWVIVGFAAGLGLMSKYFTAVPVTLLFAYLFTSEQGKRQFKQPGFYIALLITVVLCLPHLFWLQANDFVTFRYTQQSMNGADVWYHHIIRPLDFLAILAISMLGPLFLMSFSLPSFKNLFKNKVTLVKEDQLFLLFAILGPIIVTFLIGIYTGGSLRSNWGQPLLSFIGFMLLAYLRPNVGLTELKHFLIATWIVFLIIILGFSVSILISENKSSANFPAEKLAKEAESLWRSHYERPLPFVVGNRKIAGSIAYYGEDKAKVFLEENPIENPHISLSDIKRDGGIVVWPVDKWGPEGPREALADFGVMPTKKIIDLRWQRAPLAPPIRVGIAIIPASQKGTSDLAPTS